MYVHSIVNDFFSTQNDFFSDQDDYFVYRSFHILLKLTEWEEEKKQNEIKLTRKIKWKGLVKAIED